MLKLKDMFPGDGGDVTGSASVPIVVVVRR